MSDQYLTMKWEDKYYQEGIGEITEEQFKTANFNYWHSKHREYLKQWLPI